LANCFAHIRFIALLLCLGMLPAGQTTQAAPSGTPRFVIDDVLQHPTGHNGYEELLRAGKLIATSRLHQQATQTGVTLDVRRRWLAEQSIRRALALIQQGLAKPVFVPLDRITSEDVPVMFSDHARFRSLARLLAAREYVCLADSHVPEAIDAARLGLRLGRAIQVDDVTSGMTGYAMTALVLAPMAAHLGQLSTNDCERLYGVCCEALKQTGAFPRLLEYERRQQEALLANAFADAKKEGRLKIADFFSLGDDPSQGSEEDRQGRQVIADFQRLDVAGPGALDRFFAEIVRSTDAGYARALAEHRKPAWQRSRTVFPADSSVAARFAFLLHLSLLDRLDELDTGSAMRIRLLACHCRIRRYQWEHETPPENLAVLGVGDFAIDAFTGQPLRYERDGLRYRLTSAGITADADDPRAVDGRRPISIVPGEWTR
jgi:hypothetical protein